MRAPLAALMLASLAAPAAATPAEVRIGLYRHVPPGLLEVTSPAAFTLTSGGARRRLRAATVVLRAQSGRVVATVGGRAIASGPVLRLEGPAPWTLRPAGHAARRFEGALTVRAERDRLVPVLRQALEAYVRACAGDEMPPDWPATAIEAQAIASRTYALATRGRHGSDGYDYCDLTHCQRYRGLAGADGRVEAAVERTRGRRLTWRGRPAEIAWHAACGGFRAPNEVVFGGAARPYLRGGPDGPAGGQAWCRDARVQAWRFEVKRDRLTRACRAAGLLGREEALANLSVRDRTAGGYATGVRLEGAHPRAMTGYTFWMALGPHFGWGDLKSPAFGVKRLGDTFRFEGHGLGHGVGMCQWGARGQALAGRSAGEILQFYYPGTVLK